MMVDALAKSETTKPRDGLHGRCLQQRGRHPVMQLLNILTLAQQLATMKVTYEIYETLGLSWDYNIVT